MARLLTFRGDAVRLSQAAEPGEGPGGGMWIKHGRGGAAMQASAGPKHGLSTV